MKQKHILLSALSVGVGVGVGLSLASGGTVSKWTGSISPEAALLDQIVNELQRLVIDGRHTNITFDDFPYFLSEQTRVLLTSAAYIHLKHSHFSKHTRNLSPASRAILLSGPTEIYQQMLAKALAHHFESKLLLLDMSVFSQKIQSRHGRNMKRESNYTPICKLFKRMNSWCFDEKLLLQSLYKTLVSTSETSSIILYIRDAENILLQSQKLCTLFDKMLKKISGSILILGSRVVDPDSDFREVDEKVALLFPYGIEIRAPEGETHLGSWKAQFEEDMKMIKFQDNKNHIHEVLAANDIDCDDLGSICQSDTMVLRNYIEEIVVSAVSYHLMNNKDPEFRNGKLVISMKSLSHGFSIFQDGKNGRRDTLKMETNAESSKETGGEDAVWWVSNQQK